MASNKKYSYEGQDLYVGLIIKDKNGFDFEITGFGAKRVMYKCEALKQEYSFTAHWHFVLNVIQRGLHTNRLMNN